MPKSHHIRTDTCTQFTKAIAGKFPKPERQVREKMEQRYQLLSVATQQTSSCESIGGTASYMQSTNQLLRSDEGRNMKRHQATE
ncbi:hypothetical protein DPMN_108783 [Dreissena polymorpha]|uniref:Uncharacterized protein n=1 Tax=Dreissena polymorpha TaxID=45954 RepID=A0A9D4K9S7_DREPO|nr:hypothetical protein DPMN_108783 [Dreissena polymorpha]